LTGRTCAKLIWTCRAGLRFDPDVFVGYHLIPNSSAALIAARLFRRPACYQMTSGPIEVIGGGYRVTENPVLSRLGRPWPILERLATAVVGSFDLVIVRGREAQRFVAERAAPPRVGIVPGSVDLARFTNPPPHRPYDLVFVGQLVARKMPLLFVDTAAAVRDKHPDVRVVIVGDGPMRDEVRQRVSEHGLGDNVAMLGQRADVATLLGQSRIFMLPSRNEGLSIAMAEAMICGVVPVVSNVGDLKDLVVDDETGFLIDDNDAAAFAAPIVRLLDDPALVNRLSVQASAAARAYNGLDRVAQLWASHLGAVGAALAATPSPPAAVLEAYEGRR
jgi:glycosyltransferase involved in cell wall biosynthesis